MPVVIKSFRSGSASITATSANISGQPATADPDIVERTLGGELDLLIDAGPSPGGDPSTIVDATAEPVTLVRAGAVPWDEIRGRFDYFKPSDYLAGVHSKQFPNAPAGLTFQGDAGVPHNIGWGNDMNNIMPRVGFAWGVWYWS